MGLSVRLEESEDAALQVRSHATAIASSRTTEVPAQDSGEVHRFGSLLRSYRLALGYTQQELADFSALSVRAISDLEHGRAERPRRDTIHLLAEALRLESTRLEIFVRAARPVAVNATECRDQQHGSKSYEYATVLLDSLSAGLDQGTWADALNDMAEHSWRLVAVDRGIAFLERQAA
jgi:transcriptional regulator with XRE-family HTH domain